MLKWSLKSSVFNIGFRIIDRVNIRGTNKLLFALTSDYREDIIAFLYSFDLFEYPLIIPISCNGLQHGGSKSLGTIVYVNPESMQITIFSDVFPGAVI